jgi:hypothetical protein
VNRFTSDQTMHSQAVSPQDASKQNKLYLYRPFVNAALVNGNFKTIVMLPKFVSVNEWVAINGTCHIQDLYWILHVYDAI